MDFLKRICLKRIAAAGEKTSPGLLRRGVREMVRSYKGPDSRRGDVLILFEMDYAQIASALYGLRRKEMYRDYIEICGSLHTVLQECAAGTIPAVFAANLYGEACLLAGAFEEALRIFTELEEETRDLDGPDNGFQLRARYGMARARQGLGRYEEALRDLNDILVRRARRLPPDDPRILAGMARAAGAREQMGQDRQAAELYRTLYRKSRRAFGEDHPFTLRCLAGAEKSEEKDRNRSVSAGTGSDMVTSG